MYIVSDERVNVCKTNRFSTDSSLQLGNKDVMLKNGQKGGLEFDSICDSSSNVIMGSD